MRIWLKNLAKLTDFNTTYWLFGIGGALYWATVYILRHLQGWGPRGLSLTSRTKSRGLGLGLEESIYFTQYCIHSRCAGHYRTVLGSRFTCFNSPVLVLWRQVIRCSTTLAILTCYLLRRLLALALALNILYSNTAIDICDRLLRVITVRIWFSRKRRNSFELAATRTGFTVCSLLPENSPTSTKWTAFWLTGRGCLTGITSRLAKNMTRK